MNIEEFREYRLSLKGVHEKMPFSNTPKNLELKLYLEFMHHLTYTLTLTFCIALFIGDRVACKQVQPECRQIYLHSAYIRDIPLIIFSLSLIFACTPRFYNLSF